MAAFNANAFKDNDYDISLMERAKSWTLDDTSRAIASEVFRQHWNAHLAKIRLQNRQKGIVDEVTKWDSEYYGETVLKVIPTEIARCFFNITNDMVTYNKFDGKMIECVGTNPSQYTDANWNYVFLVNFLDRFFGNTLECCTDKDLEKLFGNVLETTKKIMLDATKDNDYEYDYNKYEKQINKAFDDITAYIKKLELVKYLDELRCIRIKSAKIESKIFCERRRYEGYESEVNKKLKDYIKRIDETPEDIVESEYLNMIYELKGIYRFQLNPKGEDNPYLMVCVDLPNNPESIFKQYRRIWRLTKVDGKIWCRKYDATINDISSWHTTDLDLVYDEDVAGLSVEKITQGFVGTYAVKDDKPYRSAIEVLKKFYESENHINLLDEVDLRKKIEQCYAITEVGIAMSYFLEKALSNEEPKYYTRAKLEFGLKRLDGKIQKVCRAINLIPDNQMIDEVCGIAKEWVYQGYNIGNWERDDLIYQNIMNVLNLEGAVYDKKSSEAMHLRTMMENCFFNECQRYHVSYEWH